MSGYVSPFPAANELYGESSARQRQYATNDLLSQQQIGATDNEMVGRLAQSLLTMPEEEAAKAYGPGIAYLQQQGFAKRAPPTYPGHAVAQRLAALAVPAKDQYERGLAGQDATGFGTRWGVVGAAPGTTAAAPAGGTGRSTSYAGGIAGFEGGGAADPGDNPLWPSARGGPAGGHGFIASTWQGFAAANPELFKGMTPQQVLDARKDPALSERATNWYAGENAKVLQASGIEPTPANLGISHALGPGGAKKVLSAADNTPLSQVIPETIAQNPQYGRMTVGDLKQKYARLGPVGGAPVTQTAAAAPGAPAGGGVTRAPYQVATVGSTPPPPTQAAPAAPVAPAVQPPAATTQQPPPPPHAPSQVTIPPPPALLGNGLTREQNAEIPALQEAVRRRQMKVPEADAKLLTYQKENIAAQRQYQLDVQAQQDRQQAASDRTATLSIQQSQEKRAQAVQDAKDKAAADAAAAPEFTGEGSEMQRQHILRYGDPFSPGFHQAWAGEKQSRTTISPTGLVSTPSMSEFRAPLDKDGNPRTDLGEVKIRPGPSAAGIEAARVATVDHEKITSAIDHFTDVFKKQGGGSFQAWIDDPTSVPAQQINGAFTAMITTLRSPTYFNTGVLQPAEHAMLLSEGLSPKSWRGLFATPEAMVARLGEIKRAVSVAKNVSRRVAGMEEEPDKAGPAAPTKEIRYDPTGKRIAQ